MVVVDLSHMFDHGTHRIANLLHHVLHESALCLLHFLHLRGLQFHLALDPVHLADVAQHTAVFLHLTVVAVAGL